MESYEPTIASDLPPIAAQHTRMRTNYVDTFRRYNDSNTQISLHSHNYYELLYCRSNCNVEYLIGTDRYLLQKGDIVFISPGVSHRPLLPTEMQEPYVRDIIWLSTDFVQQLYNVLPSDFSPAMSHLRLLRTSPETRELLGHYFDIGVRETERKEVCWHAAVVANTILLMTLLRRAAENTASEPLHAEKPELLEQIIRYVEEHLSEKITLTETAKRFWVSESTICQTFRKRMGASFYRYVIQRRLIAAKVLIGRGIPLEELSVQVGFSDYSAFYRAFRQEYGISPRHYRKQLEQGVL